MSTPCDSTLDWLAARATEDAPRHLAHLAMCPACQQASDNLDRMVAALDALDAEEVTQAQEDAFIARVHAALAEPPAARPQPARRRWPLVLLAAALVLLALLVRPPPAAQTTDASSAEALSEAWAAVAPAVQTTADTQVVRGPDGIEVEVRPQSDLAVLRWGADEVLLQLTTGSVDVSLDRHERFVVETPNSRVVVVGTAFTVDFNPLVGTGVVVREGVVRVETLDGSLLREVAAGERLDIPVAIASREAPSVAAGQTPATAPSATASASAPGPTPDPVVEAPAEPPTEDAVDDPVEDVVEAIVEDVVEDIVEKKTRLSEARALMLDGDLDSALALFASSPPTDWGEAMLYGDALLLTGRTTEAELAYQSALSLGAPPTVALVELARLQGTQLDAPDRAATTWRLYLETRPDTSHATEARLAIARTSPADLEDVLRPVLAEKGIPAWQEAFALLAAHLLQQQRWPEAEALLTPWAEDPGAAGEVALVGLLRIALAQGDRAEARTLVSRYRAAFPRGARRAEVDHLASALKKVRSPGTQGP